MKRIIHDNDYMDFIMTPPKMSPQEYDLYEPKVSEINVVRSNRNAVRNDGGLGDLPMPVQGMFSGQDWVGPVVIIVVSAMALMAVYALLSKR